MSIDRTPAGRYQSLDSLRGLAALLVVFTHVLSAIPTTCGMGRIKLDAFIFPGGRFAVMLFFVLSGFVLTLPFLAGKDKRYLSFAVRRFFRIYPVFAFSIVSAALFNALLGGHRLPIVSRWLSSFWSSPPTLRVVLSHLLMAGVHLSSTRLDSPIWSLNIEMRVSLIFPVLVFFVKRFKSIGVAIALLAVIPIVKLATFLGASPFVGESVAGAVLLTCRYIPLFLLGALLASHFSVVRDRLLQLPRWTTLILVLGGTAVCIALGSYKLEARGFADLFFGLFAAYLIAVSAAIPRLAAHLSRPLLLTLGSLSYSVYLIHVPILLALCYLVGVHLPLAVPLVLVLPISLLLAALMYRFIELPSIKLGQIFARRLGPRISGTAR